MKRLILIIYGWVLAHCMLASMHSYTTESALNSGTIIKIRISETGVYMIPYDSLKSWGLNPEHVCVLGYGGAMLSENFTDHHYDDLPAAPIYMHKGSDNLFNKGDYILFYAQGAIQWNADKKGIWRHTQNPYSDYGYYFVTDKQSMQHTIAISDKKYEMNDLKELDWQTTYLLHEKDEVNLVDVSGINGGGREFYGETINSQNKTLTISFPTQYVRTDMQAHCKVALAASSGTSTPIKVTYAGNIASKNISPVTDQHTKAIADSIVMDINPSSDKEQKVNIHLNSNNSNTTAYLNYIELNIPCDLVMDGNEMLITNANAVGQSTVVRYHLQGATAQTQIWCVTDHLNIERIPTEFSGNVLTWLGNNTSIEKYVALNPFSNAWKKPVTIGKIANQNLHQLENIDYVIICPTEFIAPAERLAKKHEEIDNLTWVVVTDEQVYNEFSSGTPDASAYRWLMKMLYDRANGNPITAPKHLLLLGDGTYDNRKLIRVSGSNKLLTYQTKNSTRETEAFGTDDYFGFLQDKAGVNTNGIFDAKTATMDIGVGRLPVYTLDQANQVVDKLCLYMEDRNLGKWKSQILFLADDGDHGSHVITAEAGAEILTNKNKDFQVTKIYIDAHTQEVSAAGEGYPLAKNQFDNMLNNGVLFMNYSGHGGYNNITNELFMRINDIRRMSNANQAFWFLATCSFSHFDGGTTSAGEEAVLNPYGGAIGVLSACRTVYVSPNTTLNRNICDTILGHKNLYDYHMTLGEATRIAKNKSGLGGDNGTNKMAYILLGDPAIRLNYPTDYQVKTISSLDTLHALGVQTVKGFIETPDHDTAHWFNGKLDITIFDKIQEITTRDNDELDEDEKKRITYNDYPNTLFVGQADITDGKFEFTFMVPKDIRYNYGNGRIVYYAHDYQTQEEAIGHYEDFLIGGSSTVVVQDTIGPDINIYLNNKHFQNGDDTHEWPHFYAEIHDQSGINTAGAGIGHDLLMIIDDDAKQTYVLNSYFQAHSNSYQEGIVSYKMAEQTEGAHTLTFRAWDLYNNSSTKSLDFHVVKGLDPQLYSVTTYPNPVSSTGILNIQINHDRPDDIIEYTVHLYDISGQLIYTQTQKNSSTLQWNISEINTPSGIYVYQVNIKTTTSNFVSKAGKLIIL